MNAINRRRNAMVSERFFDIKSCPEYDHDPDVIEGYCPTCNCYLPDQYSRNRPLAFELIEKMKSLGWTVTLRSVGVTDKWQVTFEKEKGPFAPYGIAESESLCEAIVASALFAIGALP